MFKVPKIEDVEVYVSKNLKAMEEFADKKKEEIDYRFSKIKQFNKKDKEEVKLDKRKDLELEKIRFLKDRFVRDVNRILKKIPDLEKLEPVYVELLETYGVYKSEVKDALSRLRFIEDKVQDLAETFEGKVKRTRSLNSIGFYMKKFIGRACSLFNKNKKYFEKLDEFRKVVNRLPVFFDLETVAIGGFPNVGKSTLLRELTGSDVEVKSYPFTTKGLMFGYMYENGVRSLQFIDTPGMLSREKKNNIELRGDVVLRRKAGRIIYVFDVTESCGYVLESQVKLFRKFREYGVEILVFFSKSDLFDDYHRERRDEVVKKVGCEVFEDAEKLKERLSKSKS